MVGLIIVWMSISISLIMYNKWLLSYKGYSFPLAMTMTHQAFTATLAHVTCRLGYQTPPALTLTQIQQRILPIALLFATSIALSNLAVSYLTVPFMQMLKVRRHTNTPSHTATRPLPHAAHTVGV